MKSHILCTPLLFGILYLLGCEDKRGSASYVVHHTDSSLYIASVLTPDGNYLDTTAFSSAIHPKGGLTFIAELEPYTFNIVSDTNWAVTFPSWCNAMVLNDISATSVSCGDTLHGNVTLVVMTKRDGLLPVGPSATKLEPNSCVTKDGMKKENQLILRYGKNSTVCVHLHVYMPIGMVFISGTRPEGETFYIACQDDWETARSEKFERNTPVHVPKHFYLSKFTVTQAQWETVMGNNPSNFRHSDFEEPAKRPVTQISWIEIAGGKVIPLSEAFLTKINSTESPYKQTNRDYRLPSAVEWEYAARGGVYRKSAFGGEDNLYAGFQPGVHGTLTDYAWCTYNSAGTTHEVGQKLGNELGLYDMSGNVWEWTSTIFGEGSFRIIKGGCWYDSGYECRVSYWDDGIPEGAFGNAGFRLAF